MTEKKECFMPQIILHEEIVRILPKGLMTIPISLRRKFGLEDNGLVKLVEDNGRLIMEPVFILPYKVRTYTPQELKEFLNLDKKKKKVFKQKRTSLMKKHL